MTSTLHLTEALIARRSVTPEDGGCQDLVAARLAAAGFECTPLPSGPETARVSNLWALRRGRAPAGKLLVFAAHTDVESAKPRTAVGRQP